AYTLRARAAKATGGEAVGHITSSALAGFDEPGAPPVVEADLGAGDRNRLFLSSRVVAGAPLPALPHETPALLRVEGQWAGLWVPSGTPVPESLLDAALRGVEPSESPPVVEFPGLALDTPWDLLSRSPERTRRDAADFTASDLPPGVHRLGDGHVHIGEGALVEPSVVIDTRSGPVVLDRDVHVHAFTRIAGPAYVGPGSILLGGSFGDISFGPMCRIRGEVKTTIVLGYSNKAHDGFLGHAVLGRWVNLGAMTTNSNLKNNYGPVRLDVAGKTIDTGMIKVGSFLGDHVKTGIGTLLNTGTVIEAASNVFGGAMPPKYVPPFSWGVGSELTTHDIDRFLAATEVVMSRRDQPFPDPMRQLFRRAFESSAPLREPSP
ncbi:MAG: hypothetical protein HKO53_13400, partial [Gemmatimonadetes bacterium]|nr:hypothetical protein [Gemmatimonadota bacterium]